MGEMCCADNDPITFENRLDWCTKQAIKDGDFVWTPWTEGECHCEAQAIALAAEPWETDDTVFPCTCTCKCDALDGFFRTNKQCYCTCDGCGCSTVTRRADFLYGA